MKEPLLTAGNTQALLGANASRLATLTRGLSPGQLHTPPQPGEWSANDVLAHIRACCDVWGGNVARILAEEHASFAGRNPRTWMKETGYSGARFEEAFKSFAAQREEFLRTLGALGPDDWERTATVTSYGQANERTLRSYASQLAKHERTHLGQIERILAQLA